MEMRLLLDDYKTKNAQLEKATAALEVETLKVPYAEKLFSIKGESSFISKRGIKKLRKILFQVMLPMIWNHTEFRKLYVYFTTRQENPHKGKQAILQQVAS